MNLFKRAGGRDILILKLDVLMHKAYGALKYILTIARPYDNVTPDIDWRMRKFMTAGVDYSKEYSDHLEAWCVLSDRLWYKRPPKTQALKPKVDEWYGMLERILADYMVALVELRRLEDSGGQHGVENASD